MFKKLLLSVAFLIAAMGAAFADVDVNKADQASLDAVKGIGPKLAKTIVTERSKGGNFKDWADFEKRVSGIGDKNSVKLSAAGLVVNGAKLTAPAAATATTTAATATATSAATTAATTAAATGTAKVDAKVAATAKTEATAKMDAAKSAMSVKPATVLGK